MFIHGANFNILELVDNMLTKSQAIIDISLAKG